MSITIENVDVFGWEAAIRGLRNPKNSWEKSDSSFRYDEYSVDYASDFIGENDLKLMKSLVKAGSDHRKFLRMINVTCDIVAPMYWWAEFDTYKVGTVRNSCSKMHTLLSKPFEMSDFSFDKLPGFKNEIKQFRPYIGEEIVAQEKRTNLYEEVARPLIDTLNELRDSYLNCNCEEQKKIIWYSILQLLPESYNQRSTVQLNYEVLLNMYHARKDHKLDCWKDFCKWMIETLPYFKEICLGD